MRTLLLVALIVCSASAAIAAEEPRPACASIDDSKLAGAFDGWSPRAPLAAATSSAGAVVLPLGRAIEAALRPAAEVAFPAAPTRPAGAGAYGGLFAVDVDQAGDYQVVVGGPAWIEIVKDGAAITSTAHAQGPACTTVRKTVVFPLRPGRYLLEISGSVQPSTGLMVHRRTP